MTDDRETLLRAVHDAHGDDLFRYALRHTRDRELAEDVVQETLARAWKHPAHLERGEDSARAWLFTVARNLIIDDARSARHRREISTDFTGDDQQHEHAGADGIDAGGIDADGIDGVLDRILVADALAALSSEHRAVIVDAYFLGRSTRQTAAHLDIAEGTVKSRLHYGLRALRLALQERGVTR